MSGGDTRSKEERDALVADLLTRARDGDNAAFTELIKRFDPVILRYAQRSLSTHPRLCRVYDSTDVRQQVLLTLVEHLKTGEITADSHAALLKWIDTLVQRDVAKRVRQQQAQRRDIRRTFSLEVVPQQVSARDRDPSKAATTRELVSMARECLTDEELQIVELYLEGLSWRDVGARLGQTTGSVRCTWRRAVRHMRRRLPPPHTMIEACAERL